MSRKSTLKVGTVITVPVEQEHIEDSDPCNKDNCMLSRAFFAHLVALFGDRNYKVKSTNHGVIFDLCGRRFTCVFNTKTANIIYTYDKLYTSSHSKTKARAAIKPFTARLIVEASVAVPKFPPMSEETKAKLRKYPKVRSGFHAPTKTGTRRELSL